MQAALLGTGGGKGATSPMRPRPVCRTTTFLLRVGVLAIDLIDFDFDCWHRTCDDLSAVSRRSLDAVGESVQRLLASL